MSAQFKGLDDTLRLLYRYAAWIECSDFKNREVRAMTWEAPAFVEVKMDAEINSYQPDNFDREPDDRF